MINTNIMNSNATYNSFLQQVGYCKMQGYDTISRSTSVGPKMFMDGRVQFGVGLSEFQFQSHTHSCGQCIEISSIDQFFTFNDQLTQWNYDQPVETPFTVFVMDQCTDDICTPGFLDFDIYSPHQPVAYGNPVNMTWNFVPCPVEDDTIELLVCLGSKSCNVQDEEHRPVNSLLMDAIEDGYFYLHIRNARVPIISVELIIDTDTYHLVDDLGWKWNNYEERHSLVDPWLLTFHSSEGLERSYTLDWKEHLIQYTTKGYRGGILVETDIQV